MSLKLDSLKHDARVRLDRLAEIRDMNISKVTVQVRDEMKRLVSELEQINADIASEKRAAAIDESFRSGGNDQVVISKMLPLNEQIQAESRSTNMEKRNMSSWKSHDEFFKAIIAAGSPAGRADNRLYESRAAGANELVPSAGGFLVDTGLAAEIFKRAQQMYPLVGMCRKFTIGNNQNGIKIPALDESSRVDGSRSGGVTSAWTGEGSEIIASKPKIRQMEIVLNKLTGLAYLTDELMQDSTNSSRIIIDSFADELGFRVQDSILNGSGAGQPLGILQAGCLVTQTAEGGQVAKTVVFENIQKMWMRMPSSSRKNAVWLINSDIEQQMFGMSMAIGTSGIPVWLPAGGASTEGFSTLFGRPVLPVEQCKTLGSLGDIVLADMSQYAVIERGGMEVAQSLHVRFEYHEQAIRFVHRIGGQPLWSAPLTPANGTLTQSPFVTLAAR